MLLQMNGALSRRKRSRHIDIRFFFMKDRVERGELEIAYCPTDLMTADYLTKPLQSAKFRAHRRTIMGLERVIEKECVGIRVIDVTLLDWG